MDRAQHFAGPGLATADDCDDGEEVSRVRLRHPKHLMSCTIATAHTLTALSGTVAVAKAPGRACRRGGVCTRTSSRQGPTGGVSTGNEYSIQRPDASMTTGERSVLTHTHSTTHGQMPGSRYSRRLHRESWALRGMVAVSKAPGRACGNLNTAIRHERETWVCIKKSYKTSNFIPCHHVKS